jgi:methylated-DNA-[protein]-cysteine S-methyltransferase
LTVTVSIFESPLGMIRLEQRGDALVRLSFPESEEPSSPRCEGPLALALTRYFAGDAQALGAVRVDPTGTDFQKRVWQRLRAIPAGETVSYGALARELGSSARAVGSANARNPVALVVPCHRVIGADGSLTGFAYGLARKEWLLAHEARVRSAPRPRLAARA